jgi:hypothetical protein
MDRHPDTWTADAVITGLCGFYHEIAGVSLAFPLAAGRSRSMAAGWAEL